MRGTKRVREGLNAQLLGSVRAHKEGLPPPSSMLQPPSAASKPLSMVKKNMNGKRCCEEDGCSKHARGATPHCVGHGGGKRCEKDDCSKSAQGGTLRCIAHGGGRRCEETGCSKSARGGTLRCIAHGGGKRCEEDDCSKSAQGGTARCKWHDPTRAAARAQKKKATAQRAQEKAAEKKAAAAARAAEKKAQKAVAWEKMTPAAQAKEKEKEVAAAKMAAEDEALDPLIVTEQMENIIRAGAGTCPHFAMEQSAGCNGANTGSSFTMYEWHCPCFRLLMCSPPPPTPFSQPEHRYDENDKAYSTGPRPDGLWVAMDRRARGSCPLHPKFGKWRHGSGAGVLPSALLAFQV
jgi:hypothetical protein